MLPLPTKVMTITAAANILCTLTGDKQYHEAVNMIEKKGSSLPAALLQALKAIKQPGTASAKQDDEAKQETVLKTKCQ